jgi:hypothetical protein
VTTAARADLRRLLLRFELLSFDAAADFDGAARIYRRCRAAGVTPRVRVHRILPADYGPSLLGLLAMLNPRVASSHE